MVKTSKDMDKIKKRNKPNDVFMTPVPLCKEIINLFYFHESDIILDPCRGTGNFYNNYPEHCEKDWCEITDNKNFLEYDKMVDYIITNPPYSDLKNFINKAMEVVTIGFGFLLHQHALTLPRLNELKNKGFYMTKYHQCKVWNWYGHQVFVFFEKRPQNEKCTVTFSKKYIKI